MAKRDGDDNLSPEMQAKMQAAKKLQDELNAKLSQFGQIASNKNMSSVKEYDDLEKELLELKKYAASVKNENDAKLNDMINAMNKKMEKMAKTALEEQATNAKQFLNLTNEVRSMFNELVGMIETMDISPEDIQEMKSEYVKFEQYINVKSREAEAFLSKVGDLIKKVEDPNNVMKFNKEKLIPKIDEWIAKMEAARDPRQYVIVVPINRYTQGGGSSQNVYPTAGRFPELPPPPGGSEQSFGRK
ncbi:uncharacterized protein LOC106670106 isoform X2 [Cimex lectularius]|uniref:Uncharacterized protein n=1 Tax=Cimex lectularius TaxID=79782 RepID=A0A8I6S4G9_CIMLE|nr:uncharacterized protein LOC106670106 isoform X2 [Cimex lectularius]